MFAYRVVGSNSQDWLEALGEQSGFQFNVFLLLQLLIRYVRRTFISWTIEFYNSLDFLR